MIALRRLRSRCRGIGAGMLALSLSLPAWAGTLDREGDWPSHARDDAETMFSPLTQIDLSSVKRLGVAWSRDLTSLGTRNLEATPVAVGSSLYITAGWNIVLALDAETGRELWQFDPHVPREAGVRACCGLANRGVAAAGGRVFVATLDGRLIALAADSGKLLWQVKTVDRSLDYTITGAPRIVKDLVVIGNSGAEHSVRGYVTAYKMASGKKAWRFFTIPGQPGKPDGEVSDRVLADKAAGTWHGDWWKHGGGGTVWDAMAYDPALDLLYIGVGNGGPWSRQLRSAGQGDNLFLSCIVALKPDTGAYVWHFQETPGDEWDYTASQHMILTDLKIEGELRHVLMQAPKNGFFYVLDRQTGQFLSGTPYVPQNWASGLDPQTGRPNFIADSRYSENGTGFVQTPGPFGGHNWQPMSFSPRTGLVYIPTIHTAFRYTPAPQDFKYYRRTPNLGVDTLGSALPDDDAVIAELRKNVFGELEAWDPVAGHAAWHIRQPIPWNGGVLSTAGDLVFQGDATGYLVAYDAHDGHELWRSQTGAGIIAAPMTYSVSGQQYVAVEAGWGGSLPDVAGAMASGSLMSHVNRLVVFKLDGRKTLPAVAPPPAAAPQAATHGTETVGEALAGKEVFERHCAVCHGSAAISGGSVPDLRHSGAIGSAEAFNAIVLGGALTGQGMVSFRHVLSTADAAAVRTYLNKRAGDAATH